MYKSVSRLAIIVATASLTIPAAQAASSKPMSGDLAMYVGLMSMDDKYDPDYSYDNGSILGGQGRVALWINDSWTAQFDLNGESNESGDLDGSSSEYRYTNFNMAAHLTHRGEQFSGGGFVSIGSQSDWWDDRFATVGVEGTFDMGMTMINGQVGYTKGLETTEDAYELDATYGRIEMKHFFSENTSVAANVGLFRETYDSDDLDGTTWGIDLEHRFENSPMSVFLSYQGTKEEEKDEDEDWNTSSFLIGFKLSFGSNTALQAAKTGANQWDYNPLTGVSHSRFNDYE